MTIIVWSKDGCNHCITAKSLLESKGIQFEERNISNGEWTREQLFEAVPTAKSMPQIFLNGEYIGGLNELKAKL
jgi:glutaredoxin 3